MELPVDLFGVEITPPAEPDSPTVRRTKRQAAELERGRHPLTGGPLHQEAAPAGDRQAEGLRCGSCRWRAVLSHRSSAYPKCAHPGRYTAEQLARLGPPRVTHGAGSDVRAWWPGCTDHESGDPDTAVVR